jgi:hypothetical protein
MNSVVIIRFLTPYVSSITRDQDYVHSPLPLDGALAHAAYWQALVNGDVIDSPTGGEADQALMQEHVIPVLDEVLAEVRLGDLLNDSSIDERVYAVSSGFPLFDGQLYVKRGAQWVDLETGNPLTVEFEVQPIRKRILIDRLSALDLGLVSERGRPRTGELETGKGVLKAIDNRVTTWQMFEYAWLAEVRDIGRLESLLEVLKFQGMGKKRTAGFGKVLDYQILDLDKRFPILRVAESLFLDYQDQLVLMRPLPYDTIMLAPNQVVMTNLMVESGCGYRPPYWSDRRVVVREGTIFRFLT